MSDDLKPRQRAREAAHRALASRGWFPSAGDVPFDVARDLLATAFEHDSRVKELEATAKRLGYDNLEAALQATEPHGWYDCGNMGWCQAEGRCTRHTDRAALNGGSDDAE